MQFPSSVLGTDSWLGGTNPGAGGSQGGPAAALRSRTVSETFPTSYNQGMRRPQFVLALAACAALGTVAAACGQSPTVPKRQEPPITLTTTLSTTTLQRGKSDTITTTITNSFTRTARLRFNSDCQILVTIRSITGSTVVPPNGVRNCISRLDSLDVPPSGSVSRKFIWTGTTSITPPGGPSTPLADGPYLISSAINGTNYTTVSAAVKVDLITP